MMPFSLESVVLALLSGLVGAVCAQLMGTRAQKQMEIRRTKLEVLRKIAGNRAAVTNQPIPEQRARFFEGLNEVMIVFSDSPKVAQALTDYKAALNTPNHNDRMIALFKAICRDGGIDPAAFNDSLFLEPFSPKLSQ